MLCRIIETLFHFRVYSEFKMPVGIWTVNSCPRTRGGRHTKVVPTRVDTSYSVWTPHIMSGRYVRKLFICVINTATFSGGQLCDV